MLTSFFLSAILSVPVLTAGAAPAKAGAETSSPKGAADPEIVKVNGTAILQSEFQDTLLREYGQAAMENMIGKLLLMQEARARKVTADNAEVERRFANVKGQFPDDETFAENLKRTGDSPESLRQQIAGQVSIEKLMTQTGGVQVTDAEIRKAFDANKANFGIPVTRHLRVIWLKTKAEAEEVAAKVKAGADWNALAAERNIAPSKKFSPAGDYGFRAEVELPAEIGKPAFAMKVGEIKAVESKAGHHVIQVVAAKPAQPADYEKVKPDLRNALVSRKIQAALPEFVKGLREKADIQFMGPRPGK
ncbi:MAG: peptidyl-prolyl cis-trans isomerase [Elusimicrobiota bacterium]